MVEKNRNKIFDIKDRTFNYSVRAVKFYQHIYKEPSGVGLILGKQFLRSATSIGANIEEAQAAESKADFIHKCTLSQKEARESLYWLKLIKQSALVPEKQMDSIIKETDEIIAITTSIIKKCKK